MAENGVLKGEGEYWIKGMVIDENNDRIRKDIDNCVFVGNKQNMGERGVLIADGLATCTDGYILARISMHEGGTKSLHTGTLLGEIEEMSRYTSEQKQIRRMSQEEERLSEDNTRKVIKQLGKELDERLTTGEKAKIMRILERNKYVFSSSKMDIGKTDLGQHTIETGNAAPIAFKHRRIPRGLEEDVGRYVNELKEAGIIRESNSPWNFPIVVTKKKNGDIRMCVDYRALNAKTERAIFPIPSANEVFDTIGTAKYFSTLDLSSGYYQVPIAENDIPKTAFSTRFGQYEFTRMPFGLCAAPATFQRVMNVVLRGENWVNCVVYLDDVLVFGKTIDEHNERLDRILQKMRKAGLKLSPTKCQLARKEVKYLGHVISGEGVQTDPDKTKAIREYQKPMCQKELRTFLGMTGYYRNFIKEYASTTEPLCAMLRGENKFIWNEERQGAFEKLRLALISPPILALPTTDGYYVLDTDASCDSIGAVLSQIQDGKERVIAYASKAMTKTQRKYCITRKELLAIYTFVLKYKYYLIGRKFTVRTDHQALKWLLDWSSPNTSQYCVWKAELEIYDMKVEFRRGEDHTNADALSRTPPCEQCRLQHQDPQKKRNVKVYEEEAEMTEEVESERIICQLKDTKINEVEEIIQWIQNGRKKSMVGRTKLWNKINEMYIKDNKLFLKTRNGGVWVVPEDERNEYIDELHSEMGHVGIERTIAAAKERFYWAGLDKTVKERISVCESCQRNKDINGRIKAPLQSYVTRRPLEIIGIDITGPLPLTRRGNRYILGITDYFSKYSCLIPLKEISAERVARAIWEEWITKFGIPERIHSDQGTNFESIMFKEFCSLMGTKKTCTSPYYPQSDGMIERLFRTAKSMIAATMDERNTKEWDRVIHTVEYGLRNTIHKTTGYTPSEIMFGRKAKTLEWEHEDATRPQQYGEFMQKLRRDIQFVEENMKSGKALKYSEGRYNQNRWNKKVEIGDRVVIKKENVQGFDPKYSKPFQVIEKLNEWTLLLRREEDGKVVRRNYNQIKVIPSQNETTKSEIDSWKTSVKSRRVRKPILEESRHETETVEREHIPRYPRRENRNKIPKQYRDFELGEEGEELTEGC